MTPVIQKQIEIHAQSETAAQSLNLSHIFKKMKQFPEKMDHPPLVVALECKLTNATACPSPVRLPFLGMHGFSTL